MDELSVRRARQDDADAIADVFLASFAATYRFPLAHSDEQVRRWIPEILLPTEEVWVVTDPDEAVVALMALSSEMLGQLYVAPGWTAAGSAAALSSWQSPADQTDSTFTPSRSMPGPAASTSGTALLRFGAGTGQTTRKASRIFATLGGRRRNRWRLVATARARSRRGRFEPKRARASSRAVDLSRSHTMSASCLPGICDRRWPDFPSSNSNRSTITRRWLRS